MSTAPGGLSVVLYGTGFRTPSGTVRLRVGTHAVDPVTVVAHPDYGGVDEAHFRLPQDFGLRLYQTISVETPDASSNYLWIYLQ